MCRWSKAESWMTHASVPPFLRFRSLSMKTPKSPSVLTSGDRRASPVFYTQKSLFHRLAQGGKEQALAKYEQSAIPIAQRQVAWWRIASAAQMAAEPPDQCDSFAKVFRCLDSFFFA